MDTEERIKEIEKELRETPHHKATDHYIGRLRARLAQLKDQLLEQAVRKKGGGGGGGFAPKKTGDATVVLVGPPSVGKSSLINALTEANSKVAEYDFTTLTVIPGMLDYQGAKIQIFDIPGIVEGAALGKGRGREVLSVTRAADLLLLMVDVRTIGLIGRLKKELTQFGLRFDQTPPAVVVNKKTRGGLKITATTPLSALSRETVKEVAQQFKINNAELVIKEDLSLERLIDALMVNRVYLPYLVVINKTDLVNQNKLGRAEGNTIYISAKEKKGLSELKEAVWQELRLIRVYLRHDLKTDFDEPLILRRGAKIVDAAAKISTELKEAVSGAFVWGKSAKYPGQRVSLSHLLEDGDQLELIKR